MKAQRVAIDGNEANVGSRVGSNVYAYQLLIQLEKQTRNSPDFNFTVFLSSPRQPDFPSPRRGWEYKIITPKKLWTQLRFPLELLLHPRSHDLVLSLGHYAPRFSPIPSLICVMDLAYLHFPEFFRPKDLMQLKSWTEYSVRQAQHIVTISENSKLDIIREYKRAPEEISIVYPGVDLNPMKIDQDEEKEFLGKFGLSAGKYLVCVGTIQPRKNALRLIQAFEKLDDKDVKLVFVGKKGWLTLEFDEAVESSPVKDRIVVTGFVEEWQKQVLLKNSHGSILVGLYEGFGIPPVEGMALGVVPVVSKTASLPEVVGDLGILVDPYSVDDISRGLKEVLEKKVTTDLKKRLEERAGVFSWEKSGEQMLKVLRKFNN